MPANMIPYLAANLQQDYTFCVFIAAQVYPLKLFFPEQVKFDVNELK